MTSQSSVPERLEALEERLESLEARLAESATLTRAEPASPASTGDPLWVVHELERRRPDRPETLAGAVVIAGSVTLPSGAPVMWQEGAGTSGLLEQDWSGLATALGALGHPIRLEILRHVLTGVRATAELAEIDGVGTTGQLYHHLRELRSAGWVTHSGRGTYEVAPSRVVPLLAALTAAGER